MRIRFHCKTIVVAYTRTYGVGAGRGLTLAQDSKENPHQNTRPSQDTKVPSRNDNDSNQQTTYAPPKPVSTW